MKYGHIEVEDYKLFVKAYEKCMRILKNNGVCILRKGDIPPTDHFPSNFEHIKTIEIFLDKSKDISRQLVKLCREFKKIHGESIIFLVPPEEAPFLCDWIDKIMMVVQGNSYAEDKRYYVIKFNYLVWGVK